MIKALCDARGDYYKAHIVDETPVARPLNIAEGGDQTTEVVSYGRVTGYADSGYDLYRIKVVWASQIEDDTEVEENSTWKFVAVPLSDD